MAGANEILIRLTGQDNVSNVLNNVKSNLQNLNNAGGGLGGLSGSFSNLGGSIKNVAASMASALASAGMAVAKFVAEFVMDKIVQFGQAVADTTPKLINFRTMLEKWYGSAGEANKIMGQLMKEANTYGMNMGDLTYNFNLLHSLLEGLPSDQLVKFTGISSKFQLAMESVGENSSQFKKTFDNLIESIGKGDSSLLKTTMLWNKFDQTTKNALEQAFSEHNAQKVFDIINQWSDATIDFEKIIANNPWQVAAMMYNSAVNVMSDGISKYITKIAPYLADIVKTWSSFIDVLSGLNTGNVKGSGWLKDYGSDLTKIAYNLRDIWESLQPILGAIGQGLMAGIGGSINTIQRESGMLSDTLKDPAVQQALINIGYWIGFFLGALPGLLAVIMPIISAIAWVLGLLQWLIFYLMECNARFDEISDSTWDFYGAVVEAIGGAIAWAVAKFNELVGFLWNLPGKIVSAAYAIGSAVINGIISGIQGAAGGLISAVRGALNDAVSAIFPGVRPFSLPINALTNFQPPSNLTNLKTLTTPTPYIGQIFGGSNSSSGGGSGGGLLGGELNLNINHKITSSHPISSNTETALLNFYQSRKFLRILDESLAKLIK